MRIFDLGFQIADWWGAVQSASEKQVVRFAQDDNS